VFQDLPISYNIAPSQKVLTIGPQSQGREIFTTEALSLEKAILKTIPRFKAVDL
jgi:hypothetical protein